MVLLRNVKLCTASIVLLLVSIVNFIHLLCSMCWTGQELVLLRRVWSRLWGWWCLEFGIFLNTGWFKSLRFTFCYQDLGQLKTWRVLYSRQVIPLQLTFKHKIYKTNYWFCTYSTFNVYGCILYTCDSYNKDSDFMKTSINSLLIVLIK